MNRDLRQHTRPSSSKTNRTRVVCRDVTFKPSVTNHIVDLTSKDGDIIG